MAFWETKNWTIRWKLIAMIVICLFLPIAVMGYYSYFYYTRSISNKLQDAVHSETATMTNIAVDKINTIIDLSRDVTYMGEIEGVIVGDERYDYTSNAFNEYINNSLLSKYYSRSEIMFASIITTKKPNHVYYYEPTGNKQLSIFKENVMDEALKHMSSGSVDVKFIIYEGNVYLIRNLLSIRDYKNMGCLILQVSENYIFDQFKNDIVWGENLIYSINNNEYFYGKKNNQIHDIEYVEQNMEKVSAEIFSDNNLLYVIESQKTRDFEIKCMSIVDPNKVYSSSQDVFIVTVFLIILIIPFVFMILFQVYKSISVPINKMVNAMTDVQKGNFGVTYEYNKNDEFKYLFDTFNHMTLKMDSLIQNLYKEELATKDAKIMALQSQINPHFLNNTLEMLLWKARVLGDEEIEGMIESLCVIFNASMDRSNRKFVKLSEEIEYVNAFLFISEKRFKEKLEVVQEIDDSLNDILIPRLTIQPLMENAVKHGIEPVGKGTIWISIKQHKNIVLIQIINNGKILTKENEHRINNILNGTINSNGRTSLGIRNLNERIRLLYGEEYGLTIFKDGEDRTVSKLIIPILKNEEGEI